MKRRVLFGLSALAAVGVGVTALDRPAPPPPGADPVYGEIAGTLREVYDVTAWSVRMPAAWAAPRIAQVGLDAWVAMLPLPDDARARVRGRLGADGFVDELVPFALFVKELYDDPGVEGFDAWARANVRPAPGVPGYEHSLFTYTRPVASGGGGLPSLPSAQAAQILALYDAVYLQDTAADASLGERLACGRGDDAALEARAGRAAPIVRELLAGLAEGMEPGDIRDALGHVLRDDTTLEAVTLTLVEFVDAEVCKHHGVFAARAHRERMLATWLEGALLTPGRQDGWAWLRWHGARRHGVHVVVDGLQGHLVDALARGDAKDPFLVGLVEEDARLRAARPTLPSTQPGPTMALGYLRHAAEHGNAGVLPYLAKVVASPGFVRQGISSTPTISVRNLPIAKTGAPVAGEGATGVPNFHFVDRAYTRDGVNQGRPWYFYGNDALQLTALTQAAGMRTMFQRLERLVTMSCGAQYDEAARWSLDGFVALALGEKLRDFADARCVAELRTRADNERRMTEIRASLLAREPLLRAEHHPWEWYDRWAQAQERDAVRALVAELAALEPVGMPDYLLYYNPWPDHFAHPKGPFADEIVSPTGELARLDRWLAEIDATYVSAGVSSRTAYAMAGDHGLGPVYWIVSPEAEVIEGLARDGVALRVKKISSDEGEGPKLINKLRPPSMRGYDVVVASTAGGNYMLDLFVDQGESWGRQPVLAELRALETLGRKRIDVVAEILTRLGDTLDYLVVRETAFGPEGGVVAVMGPRAGATAVGTIERRGARIWYGWEGADPLGLADASPYASVTPATGAALARCVDAPRADVGAWCTGAEWRAATAHLRRPDPVTQLAHLYDTDRAGTINLFPREGVGYNTKVPGRHAGESFHEKDALVAVWGEPVRAVGGVDVAENGAAPMAIYSWILGETPAAGEDGWGYTPLPAGLFAER